MTLEEEIRRGKKADEVLSNELVVEGFAHIEAELYAKFQEVSPSDEKSVMFVKHMLYMHSKYKEFFRQVMVNGKLASVNLEAKKKSLMERAKERVFG
jgi:hypothetical protein